MGDLTCPACGESYNSDDLPGEWVCPVDGETLTMNPAFDWSDDGVGDDYFLGARSTAGLGGHGPKFQVGERVIDFRGDPATVTNVEYVADPTKSNRVQVQYDGDPAPSPIYYYEEVFTSANDATASDAVAPTGWTASKTAASSVTVSQKPLCDVHGQQHDADYDAKMVGLGGSWANVCQEGFDQFGPGRLGTGYGQRYLLPGEEDPVSPTENPNFDARPPGSFDAFSATLRAGLDAVFADLDKTANPYAPGNNPYLTQGPGTPNSDVQAPKADPNAAVEDAPQQQTQPQTTRPRVQPSGDPSAMPTDPNSIAAPIDDAADETAKATPAANRAAAMRQAERSFMTPPSRTARNHAKVRALASTIQADNPRIGPDAAMDLAVATVRRYPEMIGGSR